jgi:hypothetical protein
MREITTVTKLYTFSELNEKAQQRAIERYRENYDFTSDAESVTEDAIEISKILGISIDRIYYSGFWSQGDGACFDGVYRYKKQAVEAIKQYAPQDTELHQIALDLQKIQSKYFYSLKAICKQHGRYCHSDSMCINVDTSRDFSDVSGAEDDMEQALRAFADWIYRSLEQAYDDGTSEGQIEEFFDSNETEFTEDGVSV